MKRLLVAAFWFQLCFGLISAENDCSLPGRFTKVCILKPEVDKMVDVSCSNMIKIVHLNFVYSHIPTAENCQLQLANQLAAKPEIKWTDSAFSTQCQRLDELLVDGYTGKEFYSHQLKNLGGLKTLEFRNSNVNKVHDNILTVPRSLSRLVLSGNKIRTLDDKAFAVCEELSHLDLSYNNIEALPLGLFSKCENLQYLNLNNNKIRLIQAHILYGLYQLKEVQLSNNLISKIEEGAFNPTHIIETLNLNNNSIKELQEHAIRLPSLRKLELQFNKFVFLHDLDNSFKDCKSLQLLNLHGNQFMAFSFQKISFCGPRKVIILLDKVPSHYDQCLEKLNCVGTPNVTLRYTFKPKISNLKTCVLAPTTTPAVFHIRPTLDTNLQIGKAEPSALLRTSSSGPELDIDTKRPQPDDKNQMSPGRDGNRNVLGNSIHNSEADGQVCKCSNSNNKTDKESTLLDYIGLTDKNMWLGYLILSLAALSLISVILSIFCYMKQKKMIYHLKEQNYYFSMLNSQAPTLDLVAHSHRFGAPSVISSRSCPVDHSHGSSHVPLLRHAQSLNKVKEDFEFDTDTDKGFESHKSSLTNDNEMVSPSSTRSFTDNNDHGLI